MIKTFTASAFVIAATALVQTPDAAARNGSNNDGNEIVCVNEAVVGSRLARRRVCRTRAE